MKSVYDCNVVLLVEELDVTETVVVFASIMGETKNLSFLIPLCDEREVVSDRFESSIIDVTEIDECFK